MDQATQKASPAQISHGKSAQSLKRPAKSDNPLHIIGLQILRFGNISASLFNRPPLLQAAPLSERLFPLLRGPSIPAKLAEHNRPCISPNVRFWL
jgi:hypothetical protein